MRRDVSSVGLIVHSIVAAAIVAIVIRFLGVVANEIWGLECTTTTNTSGTSSIRAEAWSSKPESIRINQRLDPVGIAGP
jgi:hypothetical protein